MFKDELVQDCNRQSKVLFSELIFDNSYLRLWDLLREIIRGGGGGDAPQTKQKNKNQNIQTKMAGVHLGTGELKLPCIGLHKQHQARVGYI